MVPSPENPQEVQQFLSTVLSQRGPLALPYSEDTKWLIRQHLVALSAVFPSLQPKTTTFTLNDGRSVNLLQADGTVPISFHGQHYDIPIVFWLIDSYPHYPPYVFVNPTCDMVIKCPHAHVNPSGLVSVPYLQNWVYSSSNLVDLVKSLSVLFGQDPPLFSQQASWAGSDSDDAAAVFWRKAEKKLVEMEELFAALRRRWKEVALWVGEMAVEKEGLERQLQMVLMIKDVLESCVGESQWRGLEQQLQMVLMNADLLESWVGESQWRAAEAAAEKGLACAIALRRKMKECMAGYLALENKVDALDKAVQDGKLPLDQYLRKVRRLSRKQFFLGATAATVAQMRAQVKHLASRIVQFLA